MNSTNEKKGPFDALLDSYFEELMAMSEADVLDGDKPDELKASGMQLLNASKLAAAKRRLAAAKAQLADDSNTKQLHDTSEVSIAVVRDYLRRASNDPQFTLAARGLDEMSDEDAIHLYQQMKRLQAAQNGPEKEPK